MTGPAARRRPPGRYDDPRGSRAGLIAIGGVVLGVAAVAMVVLFSRYGQQDASAERLGYAVVSDTLVRVELRITKEPGATVACSVRAREYNGAELTRQLVEVSGPDTTVTRTVELPTPRRAVTGEVGRCIPR